ncbi:hypothetical protein [Actinomadura sp. HBU206391]|uniref:hypothetical protein n=1 Tax=Actinomadura sp. HBU206391 TaxID=2731692 RepID=UPI00164F512D|nr:hypothetical protein [Actinomadura sp. HBU206391]MBC6460209.1 hypothetical protein [Actinomadura sp. HBU206391]
MPWSAPSSTPISPRGSSDDGEGATSYIAVTLLIAAVTAAIATTNAGGAVVSNAQRAICKVQGDGCEPVDGKPTARSSGGATPSVPRPYRRHGGAQALPSGAGGAPPGGAAPQGTAERAMCLQVGENCVGVDSLVAPADPMASGRPSPGADPDPADIGDAIGDAVGDAVDKVMRPDKPQQQIDDEKRLWSRGLQLLGFSSPSSISE